MRVCCRLLVAVLLKGAAVLAQAPAASLSADRPAQGQRLFERQCARCHGLKGGGGEGPDLTRARLRHADTEKALIGVIRDGITGTEMAGAWQLGDHELRQVAAYVWSLSRTEVVAAQGDPAKGKTLYEKGDCAKCHTVQGQGGSLGPDLTAIGARRGPEYLRQALHDPGTTMPLDENGYRAFLVVEAATRDGRIVRGLRINEDTFTIQIRDGEGRIHSLQKRHLADLRRDEGGSLMPSYKTLIAKADFDDLVAYLASLRGEP
jgi:putative heme-binding domain-containing protein